MRERVYQAMNPSGSTVGYPFFAFVTLLIIACWGVLMVWMHVTTLFGATQQEITFLSTITITIWVLVPAYIKQVQWGYLAGMIVVTSGFFGGGIASVLLHYIHFSWSVYNCSVIVIYVIVLINVYTSYTCYENAPGSRNPIIYGVSGIILILAVTAGVFSYYSDSIYWGYMYNNTIQTIDKDLATMDTIDEKIEYLMEKGNIPSVAAGIVVKDTLVWAQAYGDCTLDTVYSVGSVTKPITATAVLQLYEKGVLDLDTTINEYLPFEVEHPNYPDIPITIRMLLQHQSGLGRNIMQHEQYMDGEALKDWAAKNFGFTYQDTPSFGLFLEELVTPGGAYYSPDVWVNSPPGTGFTYSNVGYDLLGYIVEQVTHIPLPVYAEQYIFEPLHMYNTGVHGNLTDNAIPHERIYSLFSKTNVPLPLYERTHMGAGGIRTTLPDLAQFLIAHMNQGSHPDGYQLLPAESVSLMHGKSVSVFNQFSLAGYGMGWKHQNDEPGPYFYLHGSQGHDGGTEGYMCFMWMVEPESGENYGIIIMTNMYHYYKQDPLWMVAWSSMVQDVLFCEASFMAA
jgi:CubicO group peptidase (beta-lactamase class C family)